MPGGDRLRRRARPFSRRHQATPCSGRALAALSSIERLARAPRPAACGAELILTDPLEGGREARRAAERNSKFFYPDRVRTPPTGAAPRNKEQARRSRLDTAYHSRAPEPAGDVRRRLAVSQNEESLDPLRVGQAGGAFESLDTVESAVRARDIRRDAPRSKSAWPLPTEEAWAMPQLAYLHPSHPARTLLLHLASARGLASGGEREEEPPIGSSSRALQSGRTILSQRLGRES